MQKVHVNRLKFTQVKLNLRKIRQCNAQFFLHIFAVSHELIECKHSLRLLVDNTPHDVHRVFDSLDDVLFIALNVALEDFEFGWKARLHSICHVLEVIDKVSANVEDLPQLFLSMILEVNTFKRLLDTSFNRALQPSLADLYRRQALNT